MSITAQIRENTFEVREPCRAEVIVTSTEELRAGDTLEVQFPNSWMIVSGPSFTRELQTTDPKTAHHVSVAAEGCKASFEVEIRRRHLYSPESYARHGRNIVATLSEGVVPAGTPVRVRYANTFAPYVAEVETIRVRVKGKPPEETPTLTVTPGPATAMRILMLSRTPVAGVPFLLRDIINKYSPHTCKTVTMGNDSTEPYKLAYISGGKIKVAPFKLFTHY